MQEVNKVAKIYLRRIRAGSISLDDVPERWREEVRALLTVAVVEEG